jgi:hypothetical protein
MFVALVTACIVVSAVAVVNLRSFLKAPIHDGCPTVARRTVDVGNAAELERALADATPGDLIHLGAGTYAGRFRAAVAGTSTEGIQLCGPREAVIDGQDVQSGYAFHLEADHWTLSGFSVTNAQKGIVLDRASHNILRDIAVYRIGQEGVHLRKFSSDNLVTGLEIHDVGVIDAKTGEGIYVGSAVDHWANESGGQPDASDRNRIVANKIGPRVGAECIDIKEGTTGTVVEGNTFDGSGMTAADSWIDVKGNGATIRGNTGTDSPLDGFQTHVIVKGWGSGNRFGGNHARVNGAGFGFRIVGPQNVVACDNEVSGAASGFANVSCR